MFRARSKLFTPLNIGVFELQHRLVVEYGQCHDAGREDSDIQSERDPWLTGGLIICDPVSLLSRAQNENERIKHPDAVTWRIMIEEAKALGQSVMARLRTDMGRLFSTSSGVIPEFSRRDIGRIIDRYLKAAERAKLNGFDGVELDATGGSGRDLSLRPHTDENQKRCSDNVARGTDFFLELTAALTRTMGHERVGVRFSPSFESDKKQALTDDLYAALIALNDLEIAYLHVIDKEHSARARAASVRPTPTPAAAALRRAFPGILISNSRDNLFDAINLVEGRWADAISYSSATIDIDRAHIRRIWPPDTNA
jgi:2,4-dienoyl-CoA reductase-like NADH-dependent reductase (Old Yellow Enzyme family)